MSQNIDDSMSAFDACKTSKNVRTNFIDDTRSVITTNDVRGQKMINQYIIMKTLGKGSQGTVKLCVNEKEKTKKFAMKVIKKNKLMKKRISKTQTAFDMVKTEIAIMKKLEHPNIVDLKEVLNDPELPKLYLVMEYVSGGCLLKKISSY